MLARSRSLARYAEFGENFFVVLAEGGGRRVDARAAMAEDERRERHAEAAVYARGGGVVMNDAAG